MDRYESLLLEVWREACRHIEIAAFAETFTQLLAREVPLAGLGIVRFDRAAGSLELCAAGGSPSITRPGAPRRVLRTTERRAFERWVAGGALAVEVDAAGPLALLVPLMGGDDVGGAWWAGPLSTEHGTAGAFVLGSPAGSSLDVGHQSLVRAVLEPLAVALENDSRLRELSALREAAEADKRSALSRLGREELVDTVVGVDGGLTAVIERVDLVARSDVPVLILGETGSGKEVVARAIHERSARASGPFIRVNCGAIPPELIDSELFGHERGAFTGAAATRRGWFERANDGTLLLDEIGDMPPAAQVRLLRVLQEGAFERVGGEENIRVHVRVVASTHRDLPALVQSGKFREDLWYRIAAFPIVLPPLRERKQDIPALVHHFSMRAARRFGLRQRAVTDHDLALLTAYEWPGNVRELAAVIDRAAILGEGERLDIATALGSAVVRAPGRLSAPEMRESARPPERLVSLAEATRLHIEAALAATRGKIEGARGAAELLGINPHTLRARMRKLGVDWSRFRD